MHKSLRLVLLGCAASLVIGVTFTARAAAATANGQIMPSRSNTLPPAPSGTLVPIPQPPQPGADQIEAADPTLGNPIDKPITGAGQLDRIVGGEPPPSLEALQDMRPNDEATDGLKPGRREQLQEAAHIYGAQGGLAARAFAINEMLRRYEGMLDATYDFRPLVLPIGGGQ
ncbi:type IV secretion system DotC family protein, partial [Kozakia baliensis]